MAKFKNTPSGGPTGTEMIGLNEAGTIVQFMTWYWPSILGVTLLIVLALFGKRGRLLTYVAFAIVLGQIALLVFAS